MSVVNSGRLSLSNPLVPVVLLAALVAGFLIAQRDEKSMAQPQILGLLWPNPKPLTQFELNSTSAHPFTLETLKDRWTLLFFGYTSCPDVCPTTLATLSGVMQRLRAEGKADRLQVVFVSVDPHRDTLDQIARYIGYFDSSFIGATASPERLQRLTIQLGVLHERHTPDETSGYLVDHTASVLLVDPSGHLVGIFSAPLQAEDIAQRLQAMRRFLEEQSGRS